MMPPDPLRQRMLFKTEHRALGAYGGDPIVLANEMNRLFQQLTNDGFNVSQVLHLPPSPTIPERAYGVLVIGQRLSSPVPNPTPDGVPLPGTNAAQSLEVAYSFIVGGETKTQQAKSLKEAVELAARDLASSNVQPLAIHVTSLTSYGPGDLHALVEHFKT